MGKFSFLRAVALAAAGSGVLCFAALSNSETLLSVSLSPPMPDSLTWPWRTMQVNSFHTFTPLNPSQRGFLPLCFSSPNAFPGADISKSAANAGDVPKKSYNCFSVDTIPNAAAKVGPAVVNCQYHKVEVTLQDGRTFEGTVVNADLHSDIALVKIKSKTPLPLQNLAPQVDLGTW